MELFHKWTLLKLVQILAVMAAAAGSSPHFVYREDWREKSCARVLHRVRHQLVSTAMPPDLTGDWVSYRCEIRAGPEYVIRHFSFQNNSFESVVYRYADPDCHQPLYAIQSQGRHKLLKASWTVRGGTEAEYEVTSSHIITYTHNATAELAGRLAEGCRDVHALQHLKPFSKYLIYSYTQHRSNPHKEAPPSSPPSSSQQQQQPQDGSDKNKKIYENGIDCFPALNFTLHELQLVMVELRRHHHRQQQQHHRIPHSQNTGQSDSPEHPAGRDLTRELLLGADHSRPTGRQTHKPSSFQTALKDAHTPGCGVCSRVMNAGPLYPPRLSTHTGTLLSLEGEWVSTRCESRPYGMFLTRWLHFLSDGSSWQGRYDYYHDALCRRPSFSLNAKGNYAGGTDSPLVQGAKDFSFKVTRLKITPHDQATVDSMNHYGGNGCGKAHAWAVNEEQDVTWTGGCVTLGIRLPNMERDIMKMEIVHRKLHLYVGQRLVDKKPGTAYQRERPTAFQEPLIKCDQVDLDMSINTAPGGHGWAGGIALPLSAGPEEFGFTNGVEKPSASPLGLCLIFVCIASLKMMTALS